MTRRVPAGGRGHAWARPLALLLLAAALLIAMLIVVLFLPMVEGEEAVDVGFFVFLFAGLWLYWALGAVVVLRADGHTVGWLFALAAPVTAWVFACFALGYVLTTPVPPDRMGNWLNLAGALLFNPAIILLLPAVAIVFPTGTRRAHAGVVPWPSSSRSWWCGRCRPPQAPADGRRWARNPLTPQLASMPQGVVEILALLDGIGSLSIPSVRRWEWWPSSCVPAAPAGSSVSSSSGCWSPWCPRRSCSRSACSRRSRAPSLDRHASVATLPLAALAVAVAVLRYRLYEIDRIVSRTIGWALVSLLVAVFVGVIIGLQALLAPVTDEQHARCRGVDARRGGAVPAAPGARPAGRGPAVQPGPGGRPAGDRRVRGPPARRCGPRRRSTGGSSRLLDEAVQPAGVGLWLR